MYIDVYLTKIRQLKPNEVGVIRSINGFGVVLDDFLLGTYLTLNAA